MKGEKKRIKYFEKTKIESIHHVKPYESREEKFTPQLMWVIYSILVIVLIAAVILMMDEMITKTMMILIICCCWLIYFPFTRTFAQLMVNNLKQEKTRQLILRKPKRIILIRHAQSLGNVDTGVFGTIPDNQVPLTKEGRQQAYEAGKNLRTIIGDHSSIRFFVSPYTRSKQTFEAILSGGQFQPHTYTVREEPRLREQDWGNYQVVEKVQACMEERKEFGSFYYRFPHGESGADVYDRVTAFMSSLNREWKNNDCLENFCLVSHGLTLRMFLMRYYKWSVEDFHKIRNLDNCQIVIMEHDGDGKYEISTPLQTNV